MATKTSHLSAPAYKTPNQPGNPAHTDWLSQKLSESWKLLALPLLSFITIPLIAIFLRTSVGAFFTDLNQTQVIQAFSLSLVTSLTTTAVTLLAGTPVVNLLAQHKGGFFRIADTLVDLPTVLPPSVAGIALLMAFGRRGIFGPGLAAIGINLPFTTIAVIMAQTFVAAPLYVKAATIGFAAVDAELKQAAALDGAGRWQIFRFVSLPLAGTALLSGSVLTWARALGEFGATILFAGNFPGRTQTMPLAIYIGFEVDLNVALTLAVILICFSFITLVMVKGILHRRLDANPGIAAM